MRRDYYGKLRERVGPYIEGKVDKARVLGAAKSAAEKFGKATLGSGLGQGLNGIARGFQDGRPRKSMGQAAAAFGAIAGQFKPKPYSKADADAEIERARFSKSKVIGDMAGRAGKLLDKWSKGPKLDPKRLTTGTRDFVQGAKKGWSR